MSIYDYSVKKIDGSELSLKEYEGKVMIIVNTATGCGFTPQYKELEEMYEKYHDQGLEIIDIPCNQFGNQAPGSDTEITEFCTLNYGTQFPQMKKANVNGEDELPLFTYLKTQAGFTGFGKGAKAKIMGATIKKMNKSTNNENDIKWNFTKFIIDRDGNVVARFEPTINMNQLKKTIDELI